MVPEQSKETPFTGDTADVCHVISRKHRCNLGCPSGASSSIISGASTQMLPVSACLDFCFWLEQCFFRSGRENRDLAAEQFAKLDWACLR